MAAAGLSYLYLFLQSNLLEWPVYLPLLMWRRGRFTALQAIVIVTAMNAVTHPFVFFGIMNLKLTYLQNILLAESFAIVTEGIFLRWLLRDSVASAMTMSLCANLLSWQWAPILTYLVFG